MKKIVIYLFCLLFNGVVYSQESEIDFFVIDSYVTQEEPHTFFLSVYTSLKVKTSVTIEDKFTFVLSDTLAEDHSVNIDFSNYEFDSTYIKYYIIGIDFGGNEFKSDYFEAVLPYKNMLESDKNTSLLTVCCFGGIIFGLPSPTLVLSESDSKLSLVKEIPVLSFYSGGYNYPNSFISLEYAHIFDSYYKNFLRLGYKQVFEIPTFEFISVGCSGFTTFRGFNGISPEITIGWFKISNAFTVYSKYRFNFQPSKSALDFHEFSIGLYSNFFSINL